MKKFLALLLVGVLCLSFLAIGTSAATQVVKKGTPTLDGQLDSIYKDSLTLTGLGTAANSYGSPWDGSATADVYALYDDKNLYLFADVKDDDVLSKGEVYCMGDNPISNDCFEFRLSLNGAIDTIKVAVDAYGYNLFGLAAHYEKFDYSAIQYKTTHTDTSYTIEVAVPCTKGDLDMIKSGKLGLTYQLNDIDVFGGHQNHTTSFEGEAAKTPVFYALSSETAKAGSVSTPVTPPAQDTTTKAPETKPVETKPVETKPVVTDKPVVADTDDVVDTTVAVDTDDVTDTADVTGTDTAEVVDTTEAVVDTTEAVVEDTTGADTEADTTAAPVAVEKEGGINAGLIAAIVAAVVVVVGVVVFAVTKKKKN